MTGGTVSCRVCGKHLIDSISAWFLYSEHCSALIDRMAADHALGCHAAALADVLDIWAGPRPKPRPKRKEQRA